MLVRSARLPSSLCAALAALLMITATGCPEADVVLSVDKLVLSFTRAEFIDRETPCDAPDGSGPGEVPAGTCVEGQTTNPELHRAGRAVRKTMTVSNNSNQEYTLTAAFTGPDGGPLEGQPFRLLAIGSDPEDVSNHIGDLSTLDPPLSINANAELELTIYFYGAELGVNNGRLLLQTDTTIQVENADGDSVDVPAWSEEIVLQGTVDCVSLGWDQDMDGFCTSPEILDTDPSKDCDDSPGPGHQANPGIDEEVCEVDGSGALIAQVDSDCDGFVGRPIDRDADGFCSYSASCIPEGDADAIAELQILCGNAEDDCEDDPVANPNAPFVAPGNIEVCEVGDETVQVDNNCVSEDDRTGMRWYLRDQDGDGFGEDPAVLPAIRYCGDPTAALGQLHAQCVPTGGPVGDTLEPGECLTDCNDGIKTIFPGAQPLCDGEDTDCDGVQDTPSPPLNPPSWWDISMNIDVDEDNDGRALCSGLDCDDQNNDVVVGAAELCDGLDNNCDQLVPVDEEDNDGDGYVECAGVPPTAQVQVAGQPREELVLFASPALDVLTAFQIVVQVQAGAAEGLSEDVGNLTVTLTFENGVSTTTSLKSFVSNEILAGNSTLLGLAIGDGDHAWTSADENATVSVSGTLGGDCNDDPVDPAAPAINPGASELNGAGAAICDGQDNNCDGVGHPNETDDDLDTYAECSPSTDVSGDGAGAELLTVTGAPSASGDNLLLDVVAGGSETVSEVVGTGTLTLTFVDGVSTTSSLAATLQGQVGALALLTAASGTGTTPWTAANAGTYTLVNIPGGDCNDSNPEIFLLAPELCDGFDNDCDGLVPSTELDADGDGFVPCSPNSVWLSGVVLGAAGGNDCEDDVSTEPFASVIYPGAPEIADSYYDAVAGVYVLVDNQCPGDAGYDANGVPAPGEYCAAPLISPSSCVGGPGTSCFSCVASELDLDGDNQSPATGDCDDTNAQVNDQMLELCDGFDNDCDGSPMLSEVDVDGDGYIICNPAPGVVLAPGLSGGGDCDDSNGVVNPGEVEIADGFDNDCNGNTTVPEEEDDDGDGVSELDGDCDDLDPTVWEDVGAGTAAPEICDELDNDCDGLLSDGTGNTVDEFDDDGDGFTVCDPSLPTSTTVVNDCLEHASQITAAFPGYPAFGANNYPANAAAVHPLAVEVCDGWDTDCSSGSFVTSATVEPTEFDNDGDDFIDCLDTAEGVIGFTAYAAQANRTYLGANDCADVSGDTGGTTGPLTTVYPGAPELCDGWDNPCTGSNPPFVAANSQEFDDDGDRYIECTAVTVTTGATNAAGQTILGGYDCLDDPTTETELVGGAHPITGQAITTAMAASVNPGASEACDGWNTDCNAGGPTQAVLPVSSDIPGEIDEDTDTYIECNNFVAATGVPGYAGNDCLDVPLASNAYSDNVNPAAPEVCDSWDTNCSSQPAFPNNDGEPELAEELDDDGDGYVQCDFAATAIAGGAVGNGYGGVTSGSDCLDVLLTANSYSDDVNPGETEVCDSWDTNCSAQPAYPANNGAPELAEEVDDDGDGYVQCTYSAATITNGALNNGFGGAVGDDDCLDVTTNPYSDDVNTAATEVCDGWDTDCSSQGAYPANLGVPENADELDQDGDGYIQCGTMVAAALGNGPNGEIGGSDCLDVPLASNPYSDDVNPGNSGEVCDGWDTDCNTQPAYPGNIGTPSDPDELDDDGDGYIPCDMVAAAVGNGPNGEAGSDCLDVLLTANSYSDNVNPGATEVCDGWDTDCNTQAAYPANLGAPSDADELDQDGDGYVQCDMVAGASGNGPNGTQGSDCLDVPLTTNAWSANVNPGVVGDVCDGWDSDCSNQSAYPANTGFPNVTDERDQDGDGYIQCDMVAGSAGLGPNGEFGSDCLDVQLTFNSYSDNVNPGNSGEVCDGWDTDCNTQPAYPGNDGTPSAPEELDDDGDGYIPCDMVAGAAGNGPNGESGSDCLDVALTSNSYSDNVNPGAAEVCDGWDTNCSSQPAYPGNNGAADVATELDDDGDGYVPCDMVAGAAGNGPNGESGSDCLDVALTSNSYSDNVNPGAGTDVCDGWDTDCSNQPSFPSNTGTPENADELDQDVDGYIQCDMVAGAAGNGPNGESGSDCLDVTLASNAYSDDVNPGAASDVCDGWDTDCDSQPAYPGNTGGPEDVLEQDQDADGYVECSGYVTTSGAAGITNGSDCLDDPIGLGLTYPLDTATDPAITVAMAFRVNPGASEACDGFDTNCTGGSYLPGIALTAERDGDFDDFMTCGPAEAWTPPGLGADDCADGDFDINPGVASDLAGAENLVDNDCDGFFDEDAAAGSLAMTEVMVSTSGSDGQWLEVFNASARTLSLQNWVFSEAGGTPYVLTASSTGPTDAPLQIPVGGYRVLCVDPANGTDAAAPGNCFNSTAMTGFNMSESSETVTVSVAGTTIDSMAWSVALPGNNGTSLTLDPQATPFATTNNTLAVSSPNWCEPLSGWTGGGSRRGSPGAENVSCDSNLLDLDGDGYCPGGQDTTGDGDCNDPSEGAASNDTDCDESNPAINEAATEVCDGFDTDCSSGNSFPPDVANEADDDGDGYIECTISGSPTLPIGITGGTDCNDTRSWENPGGTEICDGYDNDCAGGANFTNGGGDELDDDGDNYVECTGFTNSDGGGGFLGGSDCDDGRNYMYPGLAETCDGYDNDCTGGANFANEVDVDVDGYLLCTGFVNRSGSDAFDGGSDCDDTRAYMNAGESEVCDGYDNNCTGGANFTGTGGDELDTDGDFYVECTAFVNNDGAGGFEAGGDCDDGVATTYPTAPELCDAADNDCNSLDDDNLDGDGDGVTTCGPDGTPGNADDDCDDGNSAIFPGATEICDGYDSNCTGGGSALPPDIANELDDDGDGYIECTVSGSPTLAPGVTGGGDCRDVSTGTDSYSDNINPGASEVCDGYDTDCSTGNYLTEPANEQDDDGDGYAECSGFVSATTSGLTGGLDCRDVSTGTDSYSDNINPGASEVCDGFDTDCSTGNYLTAPASEEDDDADGYAECSGFVSATTSGLTGGGDCRDVVTGTDAYSDDINPGASEACDGYDTDCSTGNYLTEPANEQDDDGDGYAECSGFVSATTSGLTGGGDCRDVSTGTDSYSDNINPGASEACDGYDTDCSTGNYLTEPANEQDDDFDGYAECSPFAITTTSGLTGGGDCLDVSLGTNPYSNSVNPGATEACDGYDTDCVGGINATDETDADGDGYYICTNVAGANIGASKTGGDDCDDGTGGATIFPFAGDSDDTDGIDSDCDDFDCLAGDGAAGTAYSSGPYYVYCAVSDTQAAAITACEQTVDGKVMRLAEIFNSTDNAEVAALLGTGETAWIGATDVVDDVFKWDAGTNNSGTDVSSNYTAAGFTPSTNTTVDCLTISAAGAWAENACSAMPDGYVCEAE
jgi:hypothetical protein